MDFQKILATFAGIGVLIICCAMAHRVYAGASIIAQLNDYSLALEDSNKTLSDVKAQLAVAEAKCSQTQAVVESAQAQLDVIGVEASAADIASLRSTMQTPELTATASEEFGRLHSEVEKLDAGLQTLSTQLQEGLS